MKRIILLAALFMIGCSEKYITPQNGDRAQLRVVAPGFGGWAGMRIVYYENGSCEKPYVFGLISGFGTTKSDPNSGIPKTNLTEGNEYFDRFIGSGTVKMTIKSTFANGVCTIPFEANLEKDKYYEILHFWSDGKCHVGINEIVENKHVKISTKEPDKPCFTGFSGSAL